MERTVRIQLHPTPEQAQSLLETMRQFTQSFNAVCKEGWRLKEGNAYTLHRLTYAQCRFDSPALNSNLHIQARQKASEAVKSAISLAKHKNAKHKNAKKGRKVNCPQSALCPPRFNRDTIKVDWQNSVVNLSTVAGRMLLSFRLSDHAAYAVNHQVATADLMYRKGKFTLHVVLKLDGVAFHENGQALGVDLGVCRPAVTSDNRFHGKKRWREVSKRRFRLRRKLQSKGSKSAKRHLRRLAGRENRFRRDCDHILSKSILNGITAGTTVVVENLTNIRQRVKATRGEAKRRLHSWSFAQLRQFLEYKAEALGARIVGIDPRHTSQRCAVCGFIYRGNRPSQSRFVCRSCGHRANADKNAALNIRDKFLVGWSSPSDGPLPDGLSSQPSPLPCAEADVLRTSPQPLGGGI